MNEESVTGRPSQSNEGLRSGNEIKGFNSEVPYMRAARERPRTSYQQPFLLSTPVKDPIPRLRDVKRENWTFELDTTIIPVSQPKGSLFALKEFKYKDTDAEEMEKKLMEVKNLKYRGYVAVVVDYEYNGNSPTLSAIFDFCPITLQHVVGGLTRLHENQIVTTVSQALILQAGRGILALRTANIFVHKWPLSSFWLSMDGCVKVAGHEMWLHCDTTSDTKVKDKADITTVASVLASLKQRREVPAWNISEEPYNDCVKDSIGPVREFMIDLKQVYDADGSLDTTILVNH
ncbi:hypothetical protein B0J12DRAFT_705642 [Macrophomina phaseolina]|uniref:Uncharacterized protein n=1 Tax=Macrophomina phaseolina TaxID=35725 RepID=A0ABQ8FU75_9PEZI|nr:hypothetical protein B0J12DRAFT_705642 [Macrophomina phaseolina]